MDLGVTISGFLSRIELILKEIGLRIQMKELKSILTHYDQGQIIFKINVPHIQEPNSSQIGKMDKDSDYLSSVMFTN